MSEGSTSEDPSSPNRLRRWYGTLAPLQRRVLLASAGLSTLLIGLFLLPGRTHTLVVTGFILLLLSSRWWLRRAFLAGIQPPPRIGRPVSKLSLTFLLGALILASCQRLPLMDEPLQLAELEAVANTIHGYTDIGADGSQHWHPAGQPWSIRAGDHADGSMLLGVTATATLWAWRTCTGLPQDRFHHTPVRLPSLIAGLASIILIWRILHWFGYRCAALFAAFLIAIHPMAIASDTQAGGYSLAMFFELLVIASLYLALRTLKWHHWAIFAAGVVLCVCALPAAIYFATGTGLAVAFYLVRRVGPNKTRAVASAQLARLGIASLIASLVLIQLGALATEPPTTFAIEPTGSNQDAAPHRLTGTRSDASRLLTIPILAISPLLIGFGGIRLLRGNRFTTPLVVGAMISPLLAYSHSLLTPKLASTNWHFTEVLPVLILLLAVGITSLADSAKNKSRRPYLTLAAGTAYLIIFSLTTGTPAAGDGEFGREGDVEYVEFSQGVIRWRAYNDGKITRESGVSQTMPAPGRASIAPGGVHPYAPGNELITKQ